MYVPGMTQEPASVSALIAVWPTIAEFASDVGCGYEAARQMRRRESIAPDHWPTVIAAADRKGIEGVTFEWLARQRLTPATFASASGHVVTPQQPQGRAVVVGGKGADDFAHDGETAADGRAAHVNSPGDASQAVAATDSSAPPLSSSPPRRATGLARPVGPSLTGTP